MKIGMIGLGNMGQAMARNLGPGKTHLSMSTISVALSKRLTALNLLRSVDRSG